MTQDNRAPLPESPPPPLPTGDENSSHHVGNPEKEISESMQGMMLMGGVASPSSTEMSSSMSMSQRAGSSGGAGLMHLNENTLAPPPASAPPPPPLPSSSNDSPVKNVQDTVEYADYEPTASAVNETSFERRESAKLLLQSLTTSMHEDTLFGCPTTEDDEEYDDVDVDDFEEAMEQGNEGPGTAALDSEAGTLISRPGRSNGHAAEESNDSGDAGTAAACKMSMSAPPESFYRKHDESIFEHVLPESGSGGSGSGKQLQGLGSIKRMAAAHTIMYDYNPGSLSGSVGSLGATETTAAASMQPLTTRQAGANSKKSKKKPFVPPDYIANFVPSFTSVVVSDPRHINGDIAGTGFLSPLTGSSYWAYTVSSTGSSQPKKAVHIQRRFRHFDALQDRLRECCPGAILPSRPAKHSSRAIEEGVATQSPAFAAQRSKELHHYLNALIQHPIAGNAEPLHFFLTYSDDLGTAWPEVSSSALTRLAAGIRGGGAGSGSSNVADSLPSPGMDWPSTSLSYDAAYNGHGTAGHPSSASATSGQMLIMDDNTDLVDLHSDEHIRMIHVTKCIPKLERFLLLLGGDVQEKQGALGMELTKLVKDMGNDDRPLSTAADLLSGALLRSARRTRRMAAEAHAALDPFVKEMRLIRMERLAFQDRRDAFIKWWNLRMKAEQKAQKAIMQRQQQPTQQSSSTVKYEADAAHYDNLVKECAKQVEDVGNVLQSEVMRIRRQREREWTTGIKILVANMKEAHAEQASIWQEARTNFFKAFPSGSEE